MRVFETYTRSPFLRFVTSEPTSSTIPAQSFPGVNGRAGLRAYVPARMYVSTGLIPTALTLIRTSLELNFGMETSVLYFNSSGPPKLCTRIAFIFLRECCVVCVGREEDDN